MNKIKTFFIDPPSEAYYEDKLFSRDPVLNLDDRLSPFVRLKEALNSQGISVFTADRLFNAEESAENAVYSSLGILHDFSLFQSKYSVPLQYFFIQEPSVVQPTLYKALPELTKYFK